MIFEQIVLLVLKFDWRFKLLSHCPVSDYPFHSSLYRFPANKSREVEKWSYVRGSLPGDPVIRYLSQYSSVLRMSEIGAQ